MVRSTPSPTLRPTGHGSEKQKPKIAAMLRGPGPAKYRLPGTCGQVGHDCSRRQSPAYSFGARTKQGSAMYIASHSPGPVYYVDPRTTRTGRDGTPAYSLHTRPKLVDLCRSPGPAAHHAEKVHPQREPHAPAYSFGFKTEFPRLTSSLPAPNRYSLPSLVGSGTVGKKSAPAFSFTGRSNLGGFAQDFKKTPGPGTYHVVDSQVYGARSPAYSILGRTQLPGDNSKKPYPGAHSPEKVVISRKQAPSYSFGTKHSDYIAPYLDMVV